MAYTKPFTSAQKQEAVKAARSLRRNLKDMKYRYPPLNKTQQLVLLKYREAIKAFELQLKMPAPWIDPARLNELHDSAQYAAVAYIAFHVKGS